MSYIFMLKRVANTEDLDFVTVKRARYKNVH